MKKITLVLAVIGFAFCTPKANAQTFDKGTNVLNLTVGFGSGIYSGTGYSVSPAFGASFEHCFWDELINGDFSIGIGGYFGFQTSKYSYGSWNGKEYGYKYTSMIPAARGTFHWTYVENLDLYAGVHLGANIQSNSEYGDWPTNYRWSTDSGGPYFGGFVGARYYFSDLFGVTAEIGSGIAYLNLGVALKF